MNAAPSIHSLASLDWGNNIPDVSPPAAAEASSSSSSPAKQSTEIDKNIQNLEKLALVVNEAIKTGGSNEDIQKVIKKCWTVATSQSSASEVLRICDACNHLLGTDKGDEEVKKLGTNIKLIFEDNTEYIIPAYLKTVLSRESDVFGTMFGLKPNQAGIFAEAGKGEVKLGITKDQFLIFLNILKGGKPQINNFEEGIKLLEVSHYYNMSYCNYYICQQLKKFIGQFDMIAQAEVREQLTETFGSEPWRMININVIQDSAFTPQCRANWLEFMDQIVSKKPELKDQVLNLMNQVKILKMEPIWLNMLFNSAWNKHAALAGPQRVEQVIEMLNSFAKLYEGLIKVVDPKEIEKWSDPTQNAPKIQQLRDWLLAGSETPGSLASLLNSKDLQVKLLAVQLMQISINALNDIINAIKNSAKYPNEKARLIDMAKLVGISFELMEQAIRMIPPDIEQSMMKIDMGNSLTFAQYVNNLRNGFVYRYGFSIDNINSPGLNRLVASINAGTTNPVQQNAVRPDFDVDGLAIGSKCDLNFTVHWPLTLAELNLAINKNLKTITNYLWGTTGIDLSILSESRRQVCERFAGKVIESKGQNYTNMDGRTFSWSGQIPLRQEAGRLEIVCDLVNPAARPILNISCSGPDEARRWDKEIALCALLAHRNHDAMASNKPPEVNYNTGYKYTLLLPQSFEDEASLDAFVNQVVDFILRRVTFNTLEEPLDLLNAIQERKRIGEIDWSNVDEGFFADSFYLNSLLMDQFTNAHNIPMVVKIAKNTLLGLARMPNGDYNRGFIQTNPAAALAGYLHDPKYNFIPGNTPPGTPSLRLFATLHLIKALRENPEIARPAIMELVSNPEMEKNQPDIVVALSAALHSE